MSANLLSWQTWSLQTDLGISVLNCPMRPGADFGLCSVQATPRGWVRSEEHQMCPTLFHPYMLLTASSPHCQSRFHWGPAAVKQSHTTLHTTARGTVPPSWNNRVWKQGCGRSSPRRAHSLCLSTDEPDATELPSHVSSLYAPSCSQLVRNGFGDAFNAQILSTGAQQCSPPMCNTCPVV